MLRLFVITALLAALTGCRDAAFNAASKVDTSDEWKRFIEKNPSDDNIESARDRLADLELADAKRVHTVVAYKRYIEDHPEGERATAAMALLESLRFNAAQHRNNSLAWRQFIKDHPDGAHRDEADKALALAELEELPRLDDPAELARLASNHDDERGTKAVAKLDDATFKAAARAGALFAYLRDYPAGTHRDEARIRLLSLEIESQLASGHVAEARALALKAPLAKQVPKLEERLKRADAVNALFASKEDAVQRALPSYYVRSLEDLVKSLASPDPMDRWEAAEEIGEHVDVNALDPLLEALRSARHPLVRQRAFESLKRVLNALPPEVADFQVATRVETMGAQASDAQVLLTVAVLLDLSGQLARASTEYQKAFDPAAPDPVVLRRWVEIRQTRREPYSAAVAARQLAFWSNEQVKDISSSPESGVLASARTLCSARENAQVAAAAIAQALTDKVEFADDVREYSLRAQETVRLADARLRDVELKLLEADPNVRKCGSEGVRARLAEGEQQRLEALRAVATKSPKSATLVLELARERDPSPQIRTALRGP